MTLISAKFLGPDDGNISDAILAVDYATDLKVRHGIDIVATNNSWGGGGYSKALHDAILRGGDAGIVFVAAAGNDGDDNDGSPTYPANYDCNVTAAGDPRGWDCVIAVAAITRTGARASFSNSGATTVDLGAPGHDVRSTISHSGYRTYSGTSMATPHVTGALALCAAAAPDLAAGELVERLYDSVASTPSLVGRTATGGRLDVAALLESCAGFRVASTVLPPLTRDVDFTATLRATGATGAVTWSVDPSVSDPLPEGITLSEDGTLSGTPTATGTWTVTVGATDAGTAQTARRELTLTVRDPLDATAATASVSVGAGARLEVALGTSGGLAPYRWTLEDGVLPDGVLLSGASLVGTPTGDGTFPLRLRVTDAEGRTTDRELTLTVTPSDLQPVVGQPDLQVSLRRRDASPTVVVPISRRVSGDAFAGVTVQGRWRLVGTSGWTIVSGRTGVDGTVLLSGPRYRRALGRSIEFCLTSLSGTGVLARTTGLDCVDRVVTPPVAIATSSLALDRDVPAAAALSATGGLAPYSWALVSGTLPDGVSLAADGRFEGTPTVAGSFPVTVRVSDAGTPALTDEGRVTLTVREPRFLEVDAVVVTARTKRGRAKVTATVSVVDTATGRAVRAATVSGTFSHSDDGPWAPSASARTSNRGQARLRAPRVEVADGTVFAFCVTEVRLDGWRAATTDPVCSPLP